MATDGTVGLPPDGAGKLVDTTELTRSDGTTIERQRIAIGDASNPSSLVAVDPAGRITVILDQSEVVAQLKRIAFLLQILTNTEVSEADVA